MCEAELLVVGVTGARTGVPFHATDKPHAFVLRWTKWNNTGNLFTVQPPQVDSAGLVSSRVHRGRQVARHPEITNNTAMWRPPGRLGPLEAPPGAPAEPPRSVDVELAMRAWLSQEPGGPEGGQGGRAQRTWHNITGRAAGSGALRPSSSKGHCWAGQIEKAERGPWTVHLQPENHHRSGTPGHRDTGTPGHRDTGTPGHRDTGTPGHRDSTPSGTVLPPGRCSLRDSTPSGTALRPGQWDSAPSGTAGRRSVRDGAPSGTALLCGRIFCE
ncbi:unnamed protein product [Lota lota]